MISKRQTGPMKALGTVVALVVLAATLTACASNSSTGGPPGGTRATALPQGMPTFYSVPSPLPKGPPGTVIRSQQVAAPGVEGRVWRVMYLSRDELGKPIAVTGLVIVPDTPPPSGGYRVVTWSHGTNGMTDICSPSLDPAQAVPQVNSLLAAGWEVTASDYQGEGTGGLLPYLVGKVAAQNSIDIVRAARHLAFAHASTTYAAWGHSEGGQTAMFVLHIASSYAPSLHLVGVVAGAPPSQFQYIYAALETSPYRFYLIMAAAGFNAAYGSTRAPLGQVLTARGRSLLPLLQTSCFSAILKAVDAYPLSALTTGNPFTSPAWRPLLIANDPGRFTTPTTIPLLIPQGGNDQQIPVASTLLLEQHLCAIHQPVERWIYPGQSHAGVIPVYMPDMVHWLARRFAGARSTGQYRPVGEPGVQVSGC